MVFSATFAKVACFAVRALNHKVRKESRRAQTKKF
jgi:hypothetical protein